MLGVVWKGLLGRFGNHFGCRPRGGLWFSSLFVPSRVGLRAGNTVGALVGFSASLQPKQNAYTKVALSKIAEFRPHVKKRVEYRLVGGIYTPNLCYIMTLMPLPTQNILRLFWAIGHFTGWNVQIVYTIRFVLRTLSRRSSATFGLLPDLRGALLIIWSL